MPGGACALVAPGPRSAGIGSKEKESMNRTRRTARYETALPLRGAIGAASAAFMVALATSGAAAAGPEEAPSIRVERVFFGEEPETFVPDEFIVVLKPEARAQALDDAAIGRSAPVAATADQAGAVEFEATATVVEVRPSIRA